MPLDWCGAQTQGTIGFLVLNALEQALAERGLRRRVATVVTRTLVDTADPAFERPTKPVGRFLPEAEAARHRASGQHWEDLGGKGWRRVVPSPQPIEIVDAPAARALMDAGFIVVAAGGGGVPVVRDASSGVLRGVEAVIDKDLAAAILARTLAADTLVIATDVDHAVTGYGTPSASPIGEISADALAELEAAGEFGTGSMGPKVTAAVRFVRGGGRLAVITSLDRITDAVTGRYGTVVRAE